MVLFTKVGVPPPTGPQSAIWHFGWHVTDARESLATYRGRADVDLLPLYTTDEGGSVLISSDTWPNVGGVLGLTKAQIVEARSKGVQPPGGGGFAYMTGPDNALVEYAGNYPAEAVQSRPPLAGGAAVRAALVPEAFECAGASGLRGPVPTEADCKVPRGEDRTWPALNREGMFRTPRAGVEFGDVVLTWYANQGEKRLGELAGTIAGSHGTERDRSRRVDRQAAQRGRDASSPSPIDSAIHVR